MHKSLIIITLFATTVLCPQILLGQKPPPCQEIAVTAKVESDNAGQNKIVLEFSSGLDYRDFTVLLFGEKRENNRLELSSTTEITNVPKGNFYLIIHGKEEKNFCTKQLKLKVI
jgi:hypothetical protein